MGGRRGRLRQLFLIGMLCTMQPVLAAPDEIQVYTEELDAPGAFGLEQHLNYTLAGQRTPDYPGQMPSHHVLQLTPEFSYGLTDTLEEGVYVPLAFAPGGGAFLNGLRLRLKYIARREPGQRFFYGLNMEVGRDTLRTSDSLSAMEIRPIVGYRDERWLLSFNPILNLGLTANVSHQPQFAPALKLTHRLDAGVHGGIEYYGEYGSMTHMSSDQRSHALYAVADIETGGWDVNLGIGHGFAHAPDAWVMKAIVALPFR